MNYVYTLDVRARARDEWGFSENRSTDRLLFSSKKKAAAHLKKLYSDIVNDPELKDKRAIVSVLSLVGATKKRYDYEWTIKFLSGARNDCYATITKQEVR